MHHDEEHEINSDSEESLDSEMGAGHHRKGDSPPTSARQGATTRPAAGGGGYPDDDKEPGQTLGGGGSARSLDRSSRSSSSASTKTSESDDDEDEAVPNHSAAQQMHQQTRKVEKMDPSAGAAPASKPEANAYDPSAFENLKVSGEVRDLFEYIKRYKPHNIELNAPLRPFVPDYIPAVGECDAFIKPKRPDGKKDELGLKILDEPCTNQTDPTVLDLQLRALSKRSNLGDMVVRSIDNAAKNTKEIDKWIENIAMVHANKPSHQVNYSRPMPEIDDLM